jgi:hypothetical protein
MLDALDVVGIADPQDVPVVGQKTGGDVLRERDLGIALDGDMVVVPDPAKVIEAKMTCQRGRFRRDAFHHAAIAAHGIDVVIENVETGFVVAVGQPFLRDGHADARGHALAERASGGLDARYPVILRMSRCPAVKLAEALDVVE